MTAVLPSTLLAGGRSPVCRYPSVLLSSPVHRILTHGCASMSDQSSLSVGQALGRWLLHMVLFFLAGGLAAGVSALAYESIAQAQNPTGLYGVIFAAGGFIAYRLTERVLDAD